MVHPFSGMPHVCTKIWKALWTSVENPSDTFLREYVFRLFVFWACYYFVENMWIYVSLCVTDLYMLRLPL